MPVRFCFTLSHSSVAWISPASDTPHGRPNTVSPPPLRWGVGNVRNNCGFRLVFISYLNLNCQTEGRGIQFSYNQSRWTKGQVYFPWGVSV